MRRGGSAKRGFDRTQRIADLIQKTLAQMLIEDMSDERFRLVTITGVNVARDMSYAKIYVSVLTDEEAKIKEIVDALNRASKSLRYNLAHAVELRIVPELKFVYDESTAQGFRISSLIDSAIKKK
jgi:ribosome-binding factor A